MLIKTSGSIEKFLQYIGVFFFYFLLVWECVSDDNTSSLRSKYRFENLGLTLNLSPVAHYLIIIIASVRCQRDIWKYTLDFSLVAAKLLYRIVIDIFKIWAFVWSENEIGVYFTSSMLYPNISWPDIIRNKAIISDIFCLVLHEIKLHIFRKIWNKIIMSESSLLFTVLRMWILIWKK